MQYSLINTGETSNITVFHNGDVKVATSDHPYWKEIVAGVVAGDEGVVDLFDLTAPIARKFESLTDRITVANGKVYYDGDEVKDALADQITRFVREGVDDWRPLANFYEKVMTNLEAHSREQLFGWLQHNSLSITPEGNFVAYKGVESDGNGGYQSISSGKASVDGQEYVGHIPNRIGAVVTMPRSEVQHDPSVGCHTGLHAGTWNYAHGFSRDAVLEVEIDPKDVVSVPSDCNAEKLRVSRYIVRDVTENERQSVVYNDHYEDDYYEGYEDDYGYDDYPE